MTTRTKNTVKPRNTAAKRENALSRKANERAAAKSTTLPTSFRLSADLLEDLKAYVYSDRNVGHLTRTQIVEAAIRQYIGG